MADTDHDRASGESIAATVTPNGVKRTQIPTSTGRGGGGKHLRLWEALIDARRDGQAVAIATLAKQTSYALSQRAWRKGLMFRQAKQRDGTFIVWLEVREASDV